MAKFGSPMVDSHLKFYYAIAIANVIAIIFYEVNRNPISQKMDMLTWCDGLVTIKNAIALWNLYCSCISGLLNIG